jgi:hypothetical protein
MAMNKQIDSGAPESWDCVDCGINTGPGMLNRAEIEQAFRVEGKEAVEFYVDDQSEVYTVRDAVWERAGMETFGGCLCIGCLENRLGRRLRPKDFKHGAGFNLTPRGTTRLLKRRGQQK